MKKEIEEAIARVEELPAGEDVYGCRPNDGNSAHYTLLTTDDLKALAALAQQVEELKAVGTEILKMWHHVEAHDGGDRGWKELGDKLELALKEKP